MAHSSTCPCSGCRRKTIAATRTAVRSLRTDAEDRADVPVMTIYQLMMMAARYWPVRHAILYQIAARARRLIARYRLPPARALKAAANQLGIRRTGSGRAGGHFTKARIRAQRRKMARLPRHKDPRLRHTYKGKRFEEMAC